MNVHLHDLLRNDTQTRHKDIVINQADTISFKNYNANSDNTYIHNKPTSQTNENSDGLVY